MPESPLARLLAGSQQAQFMPCALWQIISTNRNGHLVQHWETNGEGGPSLRRRVS